MQRLTAGWNLARVLRVFVGATVLFSASREGQWVFAAIAALILATGLFNIGCNAQCNTAYPANPADAETKDIDFEEIKTGE